ncbi:MAG: glycosyltransferase family 39 protein [Parcubacteria group bacterium]|jgi:4-amino-4-deoxy-L-arabinose transferase-like glycosyltransferase
MNYSKIKKILNLENSLLLFISIVSAINTFLYVYFKLHKANLFDSIGDGKIGFIYFFIIISSLAVLAYVFRNPAGTAYTVKKFLLTFLPMESILIYGYLFNKIGYDKTIFNYTLRPFIGIYLAFAGFYFLFKYKKYKKIKDFFKDFREEKNEEIAVSPKDISFRGKIIFWFKKRGILATLIILSVIALNLGFGSYHLAKFAAVDEPLWTHDRIPKFWTNVLDGEFNKTMVSDKPGITVAIISGAAMNWTNPTYYKSSSWDGNALEEYLGLENLNFNLRFPILFFNCLMLLVFYFFIKKLLGKTVALISFILIGLSPLLLGISTIVNPDSLLWIFAPLSLIAYLDYLKEHRNKYLYWTGIFLGLAVLTKYVANILYVFFFGMIFLEYIVNKVKYEKTSIAEYFKKTFADYFAIVFFSLLTFSLLLPAAWVDVNRVLEGTILSKAFTSIWPLFLCIIGLVLADIFIFKNKIIAPVLDFLSKYKSFFVIAINLIFAILTIATIANTYSGMRLYDLESILASPKSSKSFGGFLGLMLANFYSLIFGLTPLAFLALLFSTITNIFPKKKNAKETATWFTYIILFIIFYYLASTAEGVSATVRYQILLYPLAMILSAIGIYQFVNIEKIKKHLVLGFVYLGISIISLYNLNSIRPFYFSYASDLLPNQYVLNLKDMGDGSYEAADYLNKLPNAQELTVWTDKRGVCSFFTGTCKSGFDSKTLNENIDYFVVSSGRESRTGKMTAGRAQNGEKAIIQLGQLYNQKNYDYKLEIGGRPDNFVKIVSTKNIKE